MDTKRRIRSTHDLASTVRGRRKELALSQAELARRAGVARKSISELETGKVAPEFGLALRVLEQLGLALEVGPGAGGPAARRSIDLDAVIDEHRRK